VTKHQEIIRLVRREQDLTNHQLHLWVVGDHTENLVRAVTRTTGHHRFYRVSATRKVTIVASDTTGLHLHKRVPQSYRNAVQLLLSSRQGFDPDTSAGLRVLAMSDAEVKRLQANLRREKREQQRREASRPRYY